MIYFENLLYEIDFFKVPFHFTIHNKKIKSSSKIGSIYSIFILGILLFFLIKSDMLNKINANVITQNIPQKYHQEININNKDFQLKFGIYDKNLSGYVMDPSIFTLAAQMIGFTTIKNQEELTIKKIFNQNISLCSNSLLISYCLDEETSFNLKGYPTENDAQYISINLHICNNETSNYSCQSQESIEKFLTGKYIGVLYNSHTYDYSDYENPIKVIAEGDFFAVDIKTWKTTKIFLKKGELYDQDNYFLSEKKLKYVTFMKDYTITDFSQGFLQSKSTPLAQFVIYSSMNTQESIRNYQKLGDLAASLGGIFNILLFIGWIFIKKIIEYEIKQNFIDKLYKQKTPLSINCHKNFNKNKLDLKERNNQSKRNNQSN